MHSTHDLRPVVVAGGLLVAMLASVLSGCGADRAVGDAHRRAERHLRDALTAAVACVEGRADDLAAAVDQGDVAAAVTGCAGVVLLDQSEESILAADGLDSENGTLAITSDIDARSTTVTFYARGVGVVEAGVSRARTTLASCWRVVVPAGDGARPEIAGTGCSRVVLERLNPTSEVSFDEVAPQSVG